MVIHQGDLLGLGVVLRAGPGFTQALQHYKVTSASNKILIISQGLCGNIAGIVYMYLLMFISVE